MAEPAPAASTEETVGASADSSAVVPIPVEDDVVIEAGDAVVEYDADGAVTKDSLVMLLRHLTEKVQERRVALKAAVESGEMPESEFERGLGQAIPEIENAVNERVSLRAGWPGLGRLALPHPLPVGPCRSAGSVVRGAHRVMKEGAEEATSELPRLQVQAPLLF